MAPPAVRGKALPQTARRRQDLPLPRRIEPLIRSCGRPNAACATLAQLLL